MKHKIVLPIKCSTVKRLEILCDPVAYMVIFAGVFYLTLVRIYEWWNENGIEVCCIGEGGGGGA